MFKIQFATEQKINLIKTLRSLTGLGLKEAKDMVEQGAIVDDSQIGPFLRAVKAGAVTYTGWDAKPVVYTTSIEPYELPRNQPVVLPLGTVFQY